MEKDRVKTFEGGRVQGVNDGIYLLGNDDDDDDTNNDIWSRKIVEGSCEVKLLTICRDGKAEVGRVMKSRSEKIRNGES